MRKIFVDLGAYNGDTIEQFYNWGQIWGDTKEWEVFGFEPNPAYRDALKLLEEQKHCVKIEEKAAWTDDGKIEMAVEDGLGSTVMNSKVKVWDNCPKIEVECFDFSEWLKQFDDELVVVKMDIEGAEFPVLEKMMEDGTHRIPTHLWVEFHQNKVTEYSTIDKRNLIGALRLGGAAIGEWH